MTKCPFIKKYSAERTRDVSAARSTPPRGNARVRARRRAGAWGRLANEVLIPISSIINSNINSKLSESSGLPSYPPLQRGGATEENRGETRLTLIIRRTRPASWPTRSPCPRSCTYPWSEKAVHVTSVYLGKSGIAYLCYERVFVIRSTVLYRLMVTIVFPLIFQDMRD